MTMGIQIPNDPALAERIARLSSRLHVSEDKLLTRALDDLEANLNRYERNPEAPEWLRKFWKDHPLPPPVGLKADKAFYDWLSGEEDE